ncbi:DNA topoisomerase III [Pseudoalteromonas peptidolytica]|uniref:DNA topoisomerase n=1 Tax=Pseudoalteromonas peptidolytica F12-50-A1 TaxID=1315280 RepID=A0A8I0MXK7_9GAMM|nr:DNA topoisomerase III [Pseudoalteromonas peptidolytica]MBE0347750.1 DNA topoisomerase III [Pseudoalteromonas peptidolytica F12-50-A1]NLR16076.1 DNA topoisomerase III [Pseudoalteromonas peptidolytica]GEK11125.1 DNA topoisomerase 3 [Pseudoalteromonas peptidolytica]
MKLYIAEKPSLGRAIADVLPKPHKKQDGYIELANGDVVSWCIGHLLEQAEPEDYDAKYKKWQFHDLPIMPAQWQFKAKAKTKKQLTTLKRLLTKADEIYHAGDPDREGQLLVDEVFQYVSLPEQKRATIQRLLISDLNPQAVKKALASTRSNQEFIPLSVSALARARADWLFGMNLTRAFTLAGQKAGVNTVLSVGRVQTPVLGLVVRRDLEIESFVSKPFYEVIAHINKPDWGIFEAKWVPSEACKPYMDEDGRVLVKALAENVAARINKKQATVKQVETKPKKINPPLPYNLSSLQIDANKRYGLSAQQVLDICQTLYEKHKLITYPRSDNRYLPKEHFAEREQVVCAAEHNQGLESKYVKLADMSKKGACWNDKKVEAHHAIIPTTKKLRSAQLGYQELQVYQLISIQYLAQFFHPYRYNETQVELEIGGGQFKAQAKQVIDKGFKVLYKKPETEKESLLPELQIGEQLLCDKGEVKEKQTQPPKHYTEASLLGAMTGIARFVSDQSIKKVLKDTDGLGTEATRAGIIELLFKRQFLRRDGKTIYSTALGKAFIQTLPESLSLPDRTALWESLLGKIANKETSYNQFMQPLRDELSVFINSAQSINITALKEVPTMALKKRGGKKRKFTRKRKPSST